MRIVFSNKVMMNIPKVVSYMKNNMGCDYNTIQNIVKTMLGYVQDKINKDGSNYNHAYIYQSCWWSDGNSGIGWIYDYCSFPRQGFAVVYNMRYDQVNNMLENAKPLKSIKSLIERIEEKNVINEKKCNDSVIRLLNESKYIPIGSHKFKTKNGKIEYESIVTLQSDTSGQCCHIVEDDHCYVLFNGHDLNDNDCQRITYIFPEAFKALKDLPLL